MGFLGACFAVYVCVCMCVCVLLVSLELIRYANTHAYLIYRKYTFSTRTSFFLKKKTEFLAEIVLLLKAIVWELCKRFLDLILVFVRLLIKENTIKCYYKRKCKYYRSCVRNPASGFLQIWNKSEKMIMTSQITSMTSLSIFLMFSCFPCQV